MLKKLKSLIFNIFIIIGISFGFSGYVFAEQVVAQVVWVKGKIQAVGADKKTRELKRRDFVYQKDVITTDASSTGQIVFTDKGLLSFKENTTFKIEEYRFSNGKTPKQDKFVVKIAKGGFRTITGAIAKGEPDNYEMVTPVATIGVRGTEYLLTLKDNCKNFASACLSVGITKGAIEVSNSGGKVVLSPETTAYANIKSATIAPVSTTKAPADLTNNPPPPLEKTAPSTELLTESAATAPAPTNATTESPAAAAEPTKTEEVPAAEEKTSSESNAASDEKSSEEPSAASEEKSSEEPIAASEEKPSEEPSAAPEEKPSEEPSAAPEEKPSEEPSAAPEEKPSEEPSAAPEETTSTEANKTNEPKASSESSAPAAATSESTETSAPVKPINKAPAAEKSSMAPAATEKSSTSPTATKTTTKTETKTEAIPAKTEIKTTPVKSENNANENSSDKDKKDKKEKTNKGKNEGNNGKGNDNKSNNGKGPTDKPNVPAGGKTVSNFCIS